MRVERRIAKNGELPKSKRTRYSAAIRSLFLTGLYLLCSPLPHAIGADVPAGDFYSLAIDPKTPDTLYAAGYGGGLYKSADGGASWSAMNGGLPSTNVFALAIDPATPTTLYVGLTLGGVFKSVDGGANWNAVRSGLTNPDVLTLAIDPATPTTLYAGTNRGGVFKSVDGGLSWSNFNNSLRDELVYALAIDPVTPTTLYSGSFSGSRGVYKSINGAGSWYKTGDEFTRPFAQALAIDPTTPTTLYAATSRSGVLKSIDGGTSWNAVNNGLTTSNVWAVAIDPAMPTTLYAGTDGSGVFKSVDGGGSWNQMNNGLSNSFVLSLAINPATPMTLYAGTKGGGVFKSVDAAASWLAPAPAPVVFEGGMVNAASFLPAGLPSYGIARGSMFTVFGQDLGPAEFMGALSLPLTTELGGSSISVTVNNVTRSAFIIYVQAGQLSAILPSDVPAGVGTLTVTYNGMSSAPVAIATVDSTFGIFSRNLAGSGPGIVQNYVSESEQPVNAVIGAAHPGQAVIIWGTGLGPIDGSDANVPPVGNLPVDVKVWVGGKLAAVEYAGRTSEFAGIDQINVVIPDGVTGCYVPVVVVVNGIPSNYVTVAVTEEGDYCSDFQIFRPGELQTVTQDGMGGFAFAEMDRFRGILQLGADSAEIAVDEGRAQFNDYTTDEIVAMTPKRDAKAPLGSCIVYLSRADGFSDPVQRTRLSAGDQLSLQGPLGLKVWDIDANNSEYETELGGGFGDEAQPVFLDPGLYTFSGGSPAHDVGMFSVNLTLLTGLDWTNAEQFQVVSREDENLTLEWSGADPSKEFVVAALLSVDVVNDVAGSAFCSVAADANTFTFPDYVLRSLPASSPWDGDSDPTGLLSVGAESMSSEGQFLADGLVGGRFFYANRIVRTVVVE